MVVIVTIRSKAVFEHKVFKDREMYFSSNIESLQIVDDNNIIPNVEGILTDIGKQI
jgi:hypothetical protein